MKGEKLALVFLMLILLASMACAELEISEVEYERNGLIVDRVSTDNPRLADVHFHLKDSEDGTISSVSAQLMSIQGSEEMRTLAINLDESDNCYGNAVAGYECIIRDIYVKPSSGSGNILIEAEIGDNILEGAIDYDFNIDDENPIVNSITINGCQENECYIGPGGELQIEVDNGPVENGFIFFTIDSRGPYMVRECEGNLCTREITGSCTHGNDVNVRVASSAEGVPSQDDAGNPVDYSTGIEERNFICDSEEPVIIDYVIESEDDSGYLIKDSHVRIIYTVDDDSPVAGSADLSSIAGEQDAALAACSPSGEYQECIFEFDVAEDGFKRANADFAFIDKAGNEIIERRELEILETGSDAEADHDFWSVRKVEVSPDSINRKTLKNYDREVMAAVYLEGPSDAEILRQSLNGCEAMDMDFPVDGVLQIPGKTSQIKITIPREAWNSGEDTININCAMEVASRVGNVVFQDSEQEEFNFEVGLDYWEDVPALIEQNLAEFQDDKSRYESMLGNAKKVSNLASGMCRISQLLKLSQSGVATGQAAVCGGSRATVVLAPVGEAIGNALRGIQTTLGISADTSWAAGGFVCNLMTCDYEGLFGGLDGVWERTPGSEYLESLGYQKEEFLDPKANLGVSLATMCIPGIVSNLEQYQQISCEYERCVAEDALGYGLPLASCEEARAVNKCRYTTGQTVNSALGLVGGNVIGSVKNMVQEYITNPFTWVGFAASQACQANPECVSNAACVVTTAGATAADIINIRDNVVAVRDSFQQLMSNDVPFCQLSEEMREANVRKTLFEIWSDGERPQQNLVCDHEFGWGGCLTGTYYVDGNTEAFLTFKYKDGTEGMIVGYEGDYYEASVDRVQDPLPDREKELLIDLSRPVQEGDIELDTGIIRMEEHHVHTYDPITQSENIIELEGELRERYNNMQEQRRIQQEADDPPEVKTQKDLAREVHGLNELKKKARFNMDLAFQVDKVEEARDEINNYIDERCQELGCDASDLISQVNRCNTASCESLEEFETIIEDQISTRKSQMEEIAPSISTRQSIGASIRTGVQLGGLANEVLPEEWHELPWHDQVNSVFDNYLSVEGRTAQYCEQKFDLPGTTVGSISSEPSRVSMHIEAYKRDGEYIITAYVSPPSSSRISFNIILAGDEAETVTDETIEIESGGDAFVRTRENHIPYEAEGEFSTVCLDFEDTVPEITRFLDGGKFCNRVVEE